MGFDKDNIVMMQIPAERDNAKKDLFAAELKTIPGVKDWSFSTSPPSGGENTHWGTRMSLIGREDPNLKSVTTIMSDDKYCPGVWVAI